MARVSAPVYGTGAEAKPFNGDFMMNRLHSAKEGAHGYTVSEIGQYGLCIHREDYTSESPYIDDRPSVMN